MRHLSTADGQVNGHHTQRQSCASVNTTPVTAAGMDTGRVSIVDI